MSEGALQACLERHRAHAAQVFRLDDELGTQHGIAWQDFVLLEELADARDGLPTASLARRVGLTPSHLLLRLLPLEKVGLVARAQAAVGARTVALRAPGRQLLREARETAAAVCARFSAPQR